MSCFVCGYDGILEDHTCKPFFEDPNTIRKTGLQQKWTCSLLHFISDKKFNTHCNPKVYDTAEEAIRDILPDYNQETDKTGNDFVIVFKEHQVIFHFHVIFI